MMNDILPIYNLKCKAPKYLILPAVLTLAECAGILQTYISKLEAAKFTIKDAINSNELHKGAFIEDRKGLSLTKAEIPNRCFTKLQTALLKSNRKFNLQLSGILDHFRLNSYTKGKFLDWHSDSYYAPLKLTAIVQLSQDYKGGELELLATLELTSTSFAIGSMLVFPSYTTHRVKKVTSGTRTTLSLFAMGEEFR